MAEKATILDLKQSQDRQIDLDSGRQIRVKQRPDAEIVEIIEQKGEVVMKIRLTDDGPVVSLQGTKLELKSTESLRMESKHIEIKSEQKTLIQSGGSLDIGSSKEMDIKSDEDVTVVGKMIHLN